MDYLPLNPLMVNTKYAFPLKIGSYDRKAIQYGYDESFPILDVLKLSDGTELQLSLNKDLDAIAQSAGPFATDEDDISMTFGSNPEASVFDISSDPLAYAKLMVNEIETLRQNVNKDHPPARIDLAHRILTSQIVFAARLACKNIGGQTMQNRGRNLDGVKRIPVPRDKQMDALRFVLDILTSRDNLFPRKPWLRMTGYCDIGAAQQACYGIEEIGIRNHTESSKLKILETLLSAARFDRLDRETSLLSVGDFLDIIVDRLFDPFENKKLWQLQTGWISIISRIQQNENGVTLGRLVHSSIRLAIERVYNILKRADKNDEQTVASHALLCFELLNNINQKK
jgi:hypothetical protein